MANKVKLVAPAHLKVDFKPSQRQYELWKNLQPECPKCGGQVEIVLQEDGTNEAVCNGCGNDNVPQMTLGGGAAGGGKSFLGSVWLISSCIRFSDIRAVVARKTLKALKESTMNTIFSIMRVWGLEEEVHYHYNQVEGTIRFWNNSVIIMKEMADTPSDPNFERFGSSEYTIAFVDEVSEISEKAIEVLFSRLRWNIGATFKVSKLLMSTNPTTNWVRTRFVQDDDGARVICRRGEEYIPFKVDDNPDKSFVAHYKRSLQKIKDVATRERLLEGNWDFVDANEAAFYNGFDGNKHLMTKLRERVYDPNKPLILSFDFNVHPFMTCLVLQVDYDNKKVYLMEEILGYPKDKRNNTPGLSKHIYKKYKRSGHKGGYVITGDPAGLARNSQTEEGVNNFSIIRNEMVGLSNQLRLLKTQPPQVLRGEWINKVFDEQYDGWEIQIDMRCRRLTEDLIYQLSNEDGTKDKTKVKDPKTGVKYEKHGHCFAPGTMVTTINGDVAIENVAIGDMVMTRNGFKEVVFSGVTATNVVVKDYNINGHVLASTTDHKYYTSENGFVEIDTISSERTFITNSIWKEKKLSLTNSDSTDIQNQKGGVTENILKGGVLSATKRSNGTFIGTCGTSTTGRYQRGATFTTSMKIQQITALKTLNVKQEQIICHSMQNQPLNTLLKSEKLCSMTIDTKLLNGTKARLVKSGIENMLKSPLLGRRGSCCVQNVGQNLPPYLSQAGSSIVQADVEKELLREYLGQSSVKSRPTSSNERIVDKVYDITVADDHEFFANGVLVHNCSDAFDYALCLFVQKSWYKYKRGGNDNPAPATAKIAPIFQY